MTTYRRRHKRHETSIQQGIEFFDKNDVSLARAVHSVVYPIKIDGKKQNIRYYNTRQGERTDKRIVDDVKRITTDMP